MTRKELISWAMIGVESKQDEVAYELQRVKGTFPETEKDIMNQMHDLEDAMRELVCMMDEAEQAM